MPYASSTAIAAAQSCTRSIGAGAVSRFATSALRQPHLAASPASAPRSAGRGTGTPSPVAVGDLDPDNPSPALTATVTVSPGPPDLLWGHAVAEKLTSKTATSPQG
jgi:hypothetical protein